MKRNYLLLLSALVAMQAVAQEKKRDSLELGQKKAHNTEENRNVMLNASSNSGPREVNIGLPSSVGGITVLENDLPVVYYFWPELPTRTWRPSQSLNMRGLISVGESTLTIGDFGYAVNSYTKTGGDKTQVGGTLKVNHHGYYLGDVNLSGKIGGNWHYSLGALVTGDPGEAKHKGSKLIDDTQVFRGILTYKIGNQGDINLGYKYARSRMIGHYAPFIYHIDGSVSEYEGFGIGTDSYMLRSGQINFRNILTGEPYTLNFTGSDSELWSSSHTFDLFGKYALGKDWTFKYSSRFRKAESSAILPLLVGASKRGSTDYTYVDDGTPYTGEYVQQMLAILSPKVKTTTWMTRLWAEKKTAQHNWRVGFLGSYYNVDNYRQDRSFLFHSVEKQPRLLLRAGSSDPYFNYNAGGEYHNGFETKLNFYASDTWNVAPWLDLSYGANFQYQKLKGDYSLQPRTPNVVLNQPFTEFDHDWYHLNADLKAIVKLTPKFGLIGNFTYQEKHGQLENYSGAYTPDFTKTKTPFIAAGVYYNNEWLSLVSQVSTLKRNNYQTRLNLTDRATGNTIVESVHYDINTKGWTTDLVLKPFKNFQLHYLITLQSPEYENYIFKNPHNTSQTISYDGNIVMGISKVLMEIDPSYTIDKFRFGLNLRYFSKQYVSLTNQFFIEPRWESFFSSSYKINKNFDLGFNVVNIFNQTGASTSIAASELPYDNIQDAEGRLVTGSYIRPLTFEFQLNFRF